MSKTPKGPEGPDLEEILNEFAPLDGPAPEEAKAPEAMEPEAPEGPVAPEASEPEAPDGPEERGETVEEPTLRLFDRAGKLVKERPLDTARDRAEAPPEGGVSETEDGPQDAQGGDLPPETPDREKKTPWWKRKGQPVHLSEKVIQLPEEDGSLTGHIGRLIEKGDRYAQGMFAGDAPEDPEQAQRERLLPGVDWEREPTHVPPRRRRRMLRRPQPDLPPGKLAARYKKGLGFLHTRCFLSALWLLPQLYLMLFSSLGLPMFPLLAEDRTLCLQVSALAMGVSGLLALDVLAHGILCLARLRLESETLVLFALVAAAGDALTMPVLGDRDGAMPYCAIVSMTLFFALWGRLLKRRGLWHACKTAASAAEPYLVTLDERMWDGRDAFVKWSGRAEGYGSQVQETEGVQRTYHIAAPVILLGSALLALIASVGRAHPETFFWCLSACLTAGCGFTAFLSFSLPYATLSQRLSKIGAALGGWDGLRWRGRGQGVVLTDTDLFPPGSVTLNGIKLTGNVSLENAVAYTATLIQKTGSGMEKPFADLLKTKGGLYRRVDRVVFHEGGVTGEIGGQHVAVGSGAFMELMRVPVAPGLKVKGAVFCAVDGYLCAIFVLHYALHTSIRPALHTLISNGLDPILATRDLLIVPNMLHQRFKLPAHRMEFPSLDRRRELSSKRQEHEENLSAVLCREGLGPYADAVVGSRRLLGAVRAGLFFDLLGAAVGLALSFYLCLIQAFASLSAGALLVFLLLWLVPSALVANWVNRY